MVTYWQTLLLLAQALFQVLGSTRAWQSDKVASEVVPQCTPTLASARGKVLMVARMEKVEKCMSI